jgi:hypothetical protein
VRGLSGKRLVQFALGSTFEDPGNLGEQIGPPPASSRSSVTAAACSPWAPDVAC